MSCGRYEFALAAVEEKAQVCTLLFHLEDIGSHCSCTATQGDVVEVTFDQVTGKGVKKGVNGYAEEQRAQGVALLDAFLG